MLLKVCISPTLSRFSQNRFGFILPHVSSLANCSHPKHIAAPEPIGTPKPSRRKELGVTDSTCKPILSPLPAEADMLLFSHSIAGMLNCSLFPDRAQVAVRAGKANRSQLERGGHKGKQTASNRYNERVRRQAGNSSAVAACLKRLSSKLRHLQSSPLRERVCISKRLQGEVVPQPANRSFGCPQFLST